MQYIHVRIGEFKLSCIDYVRIIKKKRKSQRLQRPFSMKSNVIYRYILTEIYQLDLKNVGCVIKCNIDLSVLVYSN